MSKLRPLAGYKARCGDFTMMVVSEFDEWRVIVHAPGVLLQGQRQYRDNKAKEHAVMLVKNFLTDVQGEASAEVPEPEWVPTTTNDWLVWSS